MCVCEHVRAGDKHTIIQFVIKISNQKTTHTHRVSGSEREQKKMKLMTENGKSVELAWPRPAKIGECRRVFQIYLSIAF